MTSPRDLPAGSPLSAVLWDMDGTIVDTEPYWIAAETPLVEEFGGTWTDEDALSLVGQSLDSSARILQRAGVRLTEDEIIATLTARVIDFCATQGVPFRPGALEMLRDLKAAGIKTALVTMSYRHMALAIVDLIGFDAFDVVVGGDEVERGKPHPDPYLQAAALLGVDIADTVAIEDSPNGLRSAISSGAVSLGVTNIVPLDEVGADAVWPTLSGRSAADLVALHAEHAAPRARVEEVQA